MTTATVNPLEESVKRLAGGFQTISPEEAERRRLAAELQATRRQQAMVSELLDYANIPKRQRGAEVRQAPGWSDTLKKLSESLGTGFLVALVGLRGNGKTQIAVELVRHNAGLGVKSRFCSAMEFFMDIKAGYRNDSKAEKDVITEFCKPSLLVIDEVGQRSETDWENRLIFEMINRRYNDMKDTLLISNQEEAQLKIALGPSIVSRMNETGGLIKCEWETFRK